jgi:hypothetical protein
MEERIEKGSLAVVFAGEQPRQKGETRWRRLGWKTIDFVEWDLAKEANCLCEGMCLNHRMTIFFLSH